ncbi:short-chain dehydrogenase/reductase family protein [Favolaschia claudopus]|uniref:Short-chain dehydrogenase/reductase family protein n=1 Tax=Favolaschia claudopus TaxID=2862362 RepID=A0AAW0ECS0_9AGAR
MSFPTFSATTTAEEVADAFAQQIRGKNVLITGTSLNGIGYETSRVIAKYANLVIITGYNAARLNLTEKTIKSSLNTTPIATIRQLHLDLTSLDSVRSAAAEVNAYPEPLHVLIHNAASAGGPLHLTPPNNLESQMATALFGPFLLTKLLYPKLLASTSTSTSSLLHGAVTSTSTSTSKPRIIIVTSRAHAFLPSSSSPNSTFPLPLDDSGAYLARGPANPGEFSSARRYVESKAANAVWAVEFARRAARGREGSVGVFSLHPGDIYTNIMQKEQNRVDLIGMGILNPDGTPAADKHTFKSIPQGAATFVHAFCVSVSRSTTKKYLDHSGSHLWDCAIANDKLAPFLHDEDAGKKLWEIAEEVVGERFEL